MVLEFANNLTLNLVNCVENIHFEEGALAYSSVSFDIDTDNQAISLEELATTINEEATTNMRIYSKSILLKEFEGYRRVELVQHIENFRISITLRCEKSLKNSESNEDLIVE